MSLVLHIGQPKVASTAIQAALWTHRELLASHGIAYPVRMGEQHAAQVADLIWPQLQAGAGPWRTYFRAVPTPRLAGGWQLLCDDVRRAPNAIVSAEMLSLFGPRLAAGAVADLGGGEPPTILLCVRRPTAWLVSAYGQIVRVQPTVGFETWLRATLRTNLDGGWGTSSGLHNPHLRRVWSSVGTVHEVSLDGDSLRFEEEVLEVLGISEIVNRPFLSRENVGLSAARLVAWQRLLAQRPDRSVLRTVTKPVDELAARLPGGGGRFAVVPAVADLIDRAFATDDGDGDSVEVARQELECRLHMPDPLTDVTLPEEVFAHAVTRCLEQMRTLLA